MLFDNLAELGGAIYAEEGTIFIEHSQIYENKADYGAGIYLQEAHISMSNSECTNQLALQDGGCIFSRNFVTGRVDNSVFSENFCAGNGGGIYLQNANELTFFGCQILNNTALNGGGIYFSG